MTASTSTTSDTLAAPATAAGDPRELVLTRLFDASPDKLYRAWTEPQLLRQFFAPLPWTTPVAELDVRPGGSSRIVMRDPDGNDFPNHGVYLEVVPNARLVFTDAYSHAWVPAEKPFFTAILTFEPVAGGGTRYTAVARHWTLADCETHAQMGFHTGWGQVADQLAALVEKL